jgi:hypothetical protein
MESSTVRPSAINDPDFPSKAAELVYMAQLGTKQETGILWNEPKCLSEAASTGST